jgi:hypothetical protein
MDWSDAIIVLGVDFNFNVLHQRLQRLIMPIERSVVQRCLTTLVHRIRPVRVLNKKRDVIKAVAECMVRVCSRSEWLDLCVFRSEARNNGKGTNSKHKQTVGTKSKRREQKERERERGGRVHTNTQHTHACRLMCLHDECIV